MWFNRKGIIMAFCTNCGGELFETSKFCPHCGTPVLELTLNYEEGKVKEYNTETVSADVEGLPEIASAELTPEEQAAVLEMAAENILEDIPDIKKIDDVDKDVSDDKKDISSDAPAKTEDKKEKSDTEKNGEIKTETGTEKKTESVKTELPEVKPADMELPKVKPINTDIPKAETVKAEAPKSEPVKDSEASEPVKKTDNPETGSAHTVQQGSLKSVSNATNDVNSVSINWDASSEKPKKKSKGVLIAVIAIVLVAAAGGAVFFMNQSSNNIAVPAEVTTVTDASVFSTETVAVQSEETVSETAVPSETTVVSSEESVTESAVSSDVSETGASVSDISGTESSVTSETELSETDNSETSAVSDTGYTAEDLAVGITIEGEHAVAMGNTISMEISLTEQGISPSILSSGVLFIAEYTSTASAPANITPAAMVITIDDTVIDVSATTSAEGMVIFEYDKIAEAVTAAGFTPADMDLIGIKSTSIPIDVNKIIISQG